MSMKYANNKMSTMAQWGTLTATLSTNNYADVGDVIDVSKYRTKILTFLAANNDLLAKVLGSYDGGLTFGVVLETDISVSTTAVVKTYTAPFSHIKVQVKAASGGSQGTLSTKFFGSWL
jgi:hypothetical protein